MSVSTSVLPTPDVVYLVREALRCSPTHQFERRIPDRIGDLLAELDRADERHRAGIAAFRSSRM